MQKRRPDLSALNHMPLKTSVSNHESRPVQTVGLMKLAGVESKPASRLGLLRRVLGRKTV
ncbi:hypothetical protein [Cerasicoccus arenae]|uniref:hypothetical protein n=1 Tax=Cerasicoccus arenae TaxID=424488 RepID=UPI00167B59B5|nr:hypothetical protein [Cerasicoccus arenae]MBK1859798.1 hypothetical protein [Cerasicoccus arenae]